MVPRPVGPASQKLRYVNGVYYPSWRVYKGYPPSCMPVERITHVFYAFARLSNDGSLQFLDEHADLIKVVDGQKGCIAATVQLKRRNPNLKVLLSIGGGSGSKEFPCAAATAKGRETFAKGCKQMVERFGFDGIDLDWEHPQTPTLGNSYLLLLQAIRAELSQPNLLTSALPTGAYCLKHLDLPAVSQQLDMLNLMAYDFAGPWTPFAGHHAALYGEPSAAAGVEYLRQHGFPADKIVLGVPAYARVFPGARRAGERFDACDESVAVVEYGDLPWDFPDMHHCRYDAELGAAWARNGDTFISYESEVSVVAKAEFVVSMGLAGMFFWTGTADAKGKKSLVSMAWARLVEGSQPQSQLLSITVL